MSVYTCLYALQWKFNFVVDLPLNLFLTFIAIELIYNVALVSGVQQSDSVLYISVFFRFFSLIGSYKILSIVPCAIQ